MFTTAIIVSGLISLAVVFFIGGTLLWIGGRFLARAPRATFWRSIGTHALATLCAGGISGVVGAVFSLLGPTGAALGGLLGAMAGLLVLWSVIRKMFDVSFGKAILAWLPTLGQVAIVAPLLIPPVLEARAAQHRSACAENLRRLGLLLSMHAQCLEGKLPPELGPLARFQKALLADRGWEFPRCPLAGDRPGKGYFYFGLNSYPPRAIPDGMRGSDRAWELNALRVSRRDFAKRILACDLAQNHGGHGRNVLFGNGSVQWLTEAEFQDELAEPYNSDFANALRAAGGSVRQPPPRPAAPRKPVVWDH